MRSAFMTCVFYEGRPLGTVGSDMVIKFFLICPRLRVCEPKAARAGMDGTI